MHRKGIEVWVGLFVVVGIVVVCGLILTFGEFRERFQPMYRFDVRFQNVGQIVRGAPVIMSGVVVGKVEDIGLERKGTVRLTLAIADWITIRKDAKFTIKQAGLLGDLHVVVVPQSKDAPPIQPHDIVEGMEPTDIQDTLEQAAEVVVKIKAAAVNIESATRKLDQQVMNDETLAQLRQAISNINASTTKADRLIGNVDGLVTKTTESIDSTMANLNQFSTNLSNASSKVIDIVQANETDIREAVQNIRQSTERLNAVLAGLESGKGTLGKLVVDESFYEELKRLITNLRRFGVLRYKDVPLPEEKPEGDKIGPTEPGTDKPAGATVPRLRSKPGGL